MFFRLLASLAVVAGLAGAQTYAEKLGFPKGARVLILHVDDAGMSYDSNAGARDSIERGVANSLSVMMPCPWVPDIVHWLKKRPETDAGLHLTLTSEWKEYRWHGLAGQAGLVDPEGALWPSVAAVVAHASAEEVDREIRAQYDRAVKMGFQPTHLDSHMGTLFEKPEYLERYVKLGIEKHVPVMLPGGHNSYIREDMKGSEALQAAMQKIGAQLWAAGLPVLDDLHNTSYGWKVPAGLAQDTEGLRKWRTGLYEKTLLELKPGLTMVIMHSTTPSEVFPKISGSWDVRKADMLAMTDPAFKAFLEKEGFILTTWREVARRRAALGK